MCHLIKSEVNLYQKVQYTFWNFIDPSSNDYKAREDFTNSEYILYFYEQLHARYIDVGHYNCKEKYLK